MWGSARSGPPQPDNGGLHKPTRDPVRMPQSSHQCRGVCHGAWPLFPVLHLGPLFSSVCSLLIFFLIFLFSTFFFLRRFLFLLFFLLLFFFLCFFLLSLACLACLLGLSSPWSPQRPHADDRITMCLCDHEHQPPSLCHRLLLPGLAHASLPTWVGTAVPQLHVQLDGHKHRFRAGRHAPPHVGGPSIAPRHNRHYRLLGQRWVPARPQSFLQGLLRSADDLRALGDVLAPSLRLRLQPF